MVHRNRPAKRVLVRWSDDLDKGVLLAAQYACAEAGIKLPWARVAEVMGPKFTEGAIVQHLAKLRGIMAKNNIPVPPPLKRGMITKTPSKIYNNANNKRVLEPITPMHPGTPEVPDEYKSIYDKSKATPQDGESAPAKPKARGRAKARRNMSDEDDEDEPLPELFDSDGDTGVPVKKRRRVAKPKGASAAMEVDDPPSTPSSQMIKVEPESASSIKIEQEEASIINDTAGNSVGPASRTRGLKRDYAVLQRLPSDDETEEEGSESEDADDDDVPVDDDEELIRALLTADAEDTGSAATWTPQFPLVGHASYGQVQMNGVAQANHAHGSAFPGWTNSTNMFGAHNAGNPFMNAGMMTGMTGSPGLAPKTNASNNHSRFAGNMGAGGLYDGGYQYASAHMMHALPQAYPGIATLPTRAMYDTSPDSSYAPTRNNSVATGMTSLASQSDTEASGYVMNGHAATEQYFHPEDVIGEHDMNQSMPSDEIVWNDACAEFLVDDS